MSAILQQTPEWHEARRKGIGSSDAAKVVGLSRFGSEFDLYMEKTGQAPPREETEQQYWGKKLERAIALAYAEREGVVIDLDQPLVTSPDYPFMLASLDGRIPTEAGDIGYEGKNLSAFTSIDEGIPEDIWVQVQHSMCVTHLNKFVVVMLIGGQRLEVRQVDRDQEAIDMLVAAETEFWRRVELRDPPPPDGMAATGALLRRMYPEGNGRTIMIDSPEARVRAEKIDALQANIRDIERERKALIQSFQQVLGKNEVAVLPGYGRVTWKTTRFDDEVSIDADRLQREEPEVYARFATIKPKRASRRFLTRPLKKAGDEEEENDN